MTLPRSIRGAASARNPPRTKKPHFSRNRDAVCDQRSAHSRQMMLVGRTPADLALGRPVWGVNDVIPGRFESKLQMELHDFILVQGLPRSSLVLVRGRVMMDAPQRRLEPDNLREDSKPCRKQLNSRLPPAWLEPSSRPRLRKRAPQRQGRPPSPVLPLPLKPGRVIGSLRRADIYDGR